MPGLRDWGIVLIPTMTPTATMGTFTRNTEPHQKWSSRKPPTTGPMARPIAPNTVHAAIAAPRSSGGYSVATMASAGAITPAAPTPMRARGADQRRGRRCERGDGARHPEQRVADEEHGAAAVAVGEPAAEHQQPGEHDVVAVDHPLQVARGGVELMADERQRDVRDRDVDRGRERAQAQDGEGDGAAATVRRDPGGRCVLGVMGVQPAGVVRHRRTLGPLVYGVRGDESLPMARNTA